MDVDQIIDWLDTLEFGNSQDKMICEWVMKEIRGTERSIGSLMLMAIGLGVGLFSGVIISAILNVRR